MSNPIREVTVKIRGASIQLRTDLDEDEIGRIAAYVDQKMREIDPKGMIPPAKASMLASLTIAGELLGERDKVVRSQKSLAQRLKIMHDVVDDALRTR